MASKSSANSSLSSLLESALPSDRYSSLSHTVIPALLESISEISKTLQKSHHVSLVGSANAFGDDQLNVDVASEDLIRAALAKCPSVVAASSEEDPVERAVQHGDASETEGGNKETYSVAFDPLDGSSIIAPNWTVGTIIGVWDGKTALSQDPREKQIVSILGVYGPRTTAIVAIRTPGTDGTCFEVGLGEHGVKDSEIIRSSIRLSPSPFKTRYFAPANLRSAAELPKYMSLISDYISNKYTLRYSGGLVPDIVHALVKDHGVYLSPSSSQSKAKLRRLFELCPVALILECVGGKAIDPEDGKDTLARPVENCDERAGLVCGNAEEVELVAKAWFS